MIAKMQVLSRALIKLYSHVNEPYSWICSPILKKVFSIPLRFDIKTLPLHSKLKNESLKFFKYVTENQNQITVL